MISLKGDLYYLHILIIIDIPDLENDWTAFTIHNRKK